MADALPAIAPGTVIITIVLRYQLRKSRMHMGRCHRTSATPHPALRHFAPCGLAYDSQNRRHSALIPERADDEARHAEHPVCITDFTVRKDEQYNSNTGTAYSQK